jgi:hypothetical protein
MLKVLALCNTHPGSETWMLHTLATSQSTGSTARASQPKDTHFPAAPSACVKEERLPSMVDYAQVVSPAQLALAF